MRIIEWHLETGFVGGIRKGEIEVDDDADDEEIDELVQDEALNRISWGWTEKPKDE